MPLFLLPLLAAMDVVVSGAPDPNPPQACHAVLGLTAMLSDALMDQQGVKGVQFSVPGPSSTAMEAETFQARSFRSLRRVALLIEVPDGMSLSGRVSHASLRTPRLQALRVVQVLQLDPTAEDDKTRIIVEAAAALTEAHGVYTLELQDAEGTRLLVLPGVRFPDL